MKLLKLIWVITLIIIVNACGGGGESSLSGSSANPLTYTSVATEGELISYTVDTTALTYSYEILDSAYGKKGAVGSGKLVRNSDGTYTPSGFSGKLVVLDSGLLLGTIYEDLNNDGTKEIIPVIGMSSPVASLAEAVGVYNFVSRQCGVACTNHYGTAKVNADGTWSSCVGANLAAPSPTCQGVANGSFTSFTSGKATLTVNGVSGGSMLIFKDPTSQQKVVLLDLNGSTALGKGAFFGASQSLPASADGNWHYAHTDGTQGIVTVTGNSFTDSGKYSNGTVYGPLAGSITRNLPWNGFVTTTGGAIIMPAGSGLYAGYFGPLNSMSIGVKK